MRRQRDVEPKHARKTKHCPRCSRRRAIRFFYLQSTGYYASYCKDCSAQAYEEYAQQNRKRLDAYTRQYAQRNKSLIDSLKDHPCTDCGKRYPSHVMDFDHLPGKGKLIKLSTMQRAGYSEASIIAEAAKCDVVCANCHRERTFQREQSKFEPRRRKVSV